MKFVKYENFAAIKKYIWTENMSKKEQDLSFLFFLKNSISIFWLYKNIAVNSSTWRRNSLKFLKFFVHTTYE